MNYGVDIEGTDWEGNSCGGTNLIEVITTIELYNFPFWNLGLGIFDPSMTTPMKCQNMCKDQANCEGFNFQLLAEGFICSLKGR